MKTFSISQIKQLLEDDLLTEEQINELKRDERKGVQQLLKTYERKKARLEKERAAFQRLKRFDEQFKMKSGAIIAGIDEAGRGPLAGPVVSAAVVLPDDFEFVGLTDSKQLTEKKRNECYDFITKNAVAYAISVVDNETIDRLNILEATKRSMKEALEKLPVTPDITLVDAVKIESNNNKTIAIEKGDAKSLAIASASILAKVTRDRLMDELHEQYPEYDLKRNKGYGSKKHLAALKTYGPSPIHRKSFAPVANLFKDAF